MSKPGALRLFGRAAAADARSASFLQWIALVVVVAWLIFEWGPGNEIAIPTILMAILEGIPGPEAILIMPVVGFLVGFGIQLLSGLIAAVGFSMLNHTADAAWVTLRRWHPDAESKNFLSLGWAGRWGIAFFVGTTAVVLMQLFTTGDAKASRHVRAVSISASLVGATIGAIAFVVAVAVVLARRYPPVEPYVDPVVELLSNPLFWLALLGSVLILSQLVGAIRSSSAVDGQPEPAADAQDHT